MDHLLTISRIWGIPDIPVRSVKGAVLTRKQDALIWMDSKIDPDDPVDALNSPIGYEIPSDLSRPLQVPLKIQIEAILPADWKGAVNLKLIGSLQDTVQQGDVDVIESAVWVHETSAPKDLRPKDLASFSLLPKIQSIAPFALSGDLSWRLVQQSGKTTFVEIKAAVETHLDLYWLNSLAPFRRLITDVTHTETILDMQAVYPVQLLRFYLPSIFKASTFSLGNVKIIWLQHIMSLLTPEALKVFYDTVSGMSGYSIGCCGGGFDFTGWLSRNSASVNSSDLSALIQIGVSLLLDKKTESLCKVGWVFKNPFGYIKPLNPFGWDDEGEGGFQIATGANNPYFSGNDKGHLLKPLPRDDAKLAVASRVWIEGSFQLQMNGLVTVVDTSAFLPSEGDVAELGTRSRLEYGKRHIELGQDSELENHGSNSAGSCYTSSQIPRIGVWNVKGIPEVTVNQQPSGPLRGQCEFLKVPDTLRGKLLRIIENCKVASQDKPEAKLFNDASLVPKDIWPELQTKSRLSTATTDLVLSRSLSIARYTGETSGKTKFELEIHTHVSHENAVQGLLFQLTKFECDLDPSGGPPAVLALAGNAPQAGESGAFGDYMIQHPQGFFYVLGNLLVSLTVLHCPPGTDQLNEMKKTLRNIHKYVSSRRCLRSQVRRPIMGLKSIPTDILENTAFTVEFVQPDIQADHLDAQITRCPLIIMNKAVVNGPVSKAMEFSSLAFTDRFGGSKPKVHVLGAHATTYFPEEVSFEVQVKAA